MQRSCMAEGYFVTVGQWLTEFERRNGLGALCAAFTAYLNEQGKTTFTFQEFQEFKQAWYHR
jgi:hypothetical protein